MDEFTLLVYAYNGLIAKAGEVLDRMCELQNVKTAVQARAKDINTRAARRKPRPDFVDVTQHGLPNVPLTKDTL